jgi:hypothetical protein
MRELRDAARLSAIDFHRQQFTSAGYGDDAARDSVARIISMNFLARSPSN